MHNKFIKYISYKVIWSELVRTCTGNIIYSFTFRAKKQMEIYLK